MSPFHTRRPTRPDATRLRLEALEDRLLPSANPLRQMMALSVEHPVRILHTDDRYAAGAGQVRTHRTGVIHSATEEIWSNEESLGGMVNSTPSAVSMRDNRHDVFYRGNNGQLAHQWWQPQQGWSGEESLGGRVVGNPDAVSMRDNRVDVFYRGANNQLAHQWWQPQEGWSGEESLGGVVSSDVSAISMRDNRHDVFYRGNNGQLAHQWWQPQEGWSGEESLGGTVVGRPVAVSWEDNRIDVFYRGGSNQLAHQWWQLDFNHGRWNGEENLGGGLASDPGVVAMAADRVDAFYRGQADNNLWHRFYHLGVPPVGRERWATTDITYSIGNVPAGFLLSQAQVRSVLRAAFGEWAGLTPLNFYERPDGSNVNIRITFGAIDGVSGTLANAGWSWDGNLNMTSAGITFDTAEPWSHLNQVPGSARTELFIVAVHEIGHALGLSHSSVLDSVLAAFYNPAIDHLRPDDTTRVTAKYGADQTKNTLMETGPSAPAAVQFGGRLFVAWQGTDGRLNVMASAQEGVWADKVTLNETTSTGVSLAVFNGRLFMAWRGTDGRVNIRSSADGRTWLNASKVTLNEFSIGRPTLVGHQVGTARRLVLGWTGTDSRLNIRSSVDGLTWPDANKFTLNERSNVAPALASFGGQLRLAWTGTDGRLNIKSSTTFGTIWGATTTLGETSNTGPSLLVQGSQLLLCWTGTDGRLNRVSSTNGTTFGTKVILSETSDQTAMLAPAYGGLVVVWTGLDAGRHLNVMRIGGGGGDLRL